MLDVEHGHHKTTLLVSFMSKFVIKTVQKRRHMAFAVIVMSVALLSICNVASSIITAFVKCDSLHYLIVLEVG